MAPEAADPTPPEKKPRTIDQYSVAELAELAKKVAFDPSADPDRASRVVSNISTEFLRRSQKLAEQRAIKDAVEAKHNAGKHPSREEVDAWRNASLILNDNADFEENVAIVNGIKESLTVET